MTQKCVICNIRPARNGGYCTNCEARIKARKGTKHDSTVVKYLVYRGNTVGLVSSGNGTYKPVAVSINPKRLPKDKVIDLDYYCEGFDRSQIKRFKAAIALVYAG